MKMSCSRDCLTLNKTWCCFKDSKIYETTSGIVMSTWRRSLCTFWASSKVEESVATLSSIWPTWIQKSDSCPKMFNCQPLLSASHELSQGRLRLQADAGALLALPGIKRVGKATGTRSQGPDGSCVIIYQWKACSAHLSHFERLALCPDSPPQLLNVLLLVSKLLKRQKTLSSTYWTMASKCCLI